MKGYFLSEIIRSICLAFFHSMWQGLILAGLVALFLRLTTKWGPLFRYWLLGFSYLLFLGAFVFTLVIQYQQVSFPLPGERFSTTQLVVFQVNEGPTAFRNILQWFGVNAPLLMNIWFIVFLLKTTLMIRSLVKIKHLKRNDLYVIPGDWIERWNLILSRNKFNRIPRLFQSGKIHYPMVIGWIKPVILVPVGFFTRLNPQEAEAILLHELAHLKRYDYLVNIFQVLVENIFFFNPFIYWLSSLVRKEREFCSDYWAAKRLQDNKILIKALLSFETKSYNRYIVAFSNNSYPLTQRAQRLLQHPTRPSSITACLTWTLLVSIFTIYGLTLLPFPRQKAGSMPFQTTLGKLMPVADSKRKMDETRENPFIAVESVKETKKPSAAKKISFLSKDTIPLKVSKEWMDGYNAAKKRNNFSATVRYQIEEHLTPIKSYPDKKATQPTISGEERYSKKLIEGTFQKRTD